MGSKNRIAKHILPIMLKYANERNFKIWVEPFVGGANMIDKVPNDFQRIGFDLNPHTIQALIDIRDCPNELPEEVSEEKYKNVKGNDEPCKIDSWVRFVCSFGGKFDNGYAKNNDGRNYAKVGKSNALKQSLLLQNVIFNHGDYSALYGSNAVVYCDPPYANTTGYKTGAFDHGTFWKWCKETAKNNLVFVSEYTAPNDPNIIEIWRGEIKTNFSSSRAESTHKAVEKLFLVKAD